MSTKTFSYGKQREFVNDLGLTSGQTTRCTCPACGGINTFSARHTGTNIIWHCFRANCNISGASNRFDMSIQQITEQLKLEYKKPECTWVVPPQFYEAAGNQECREMLKKFNSSFAYEKGLVSCRYDPKLKRLAFLIKYKHQVCGAVGRALDKNTLPKWYIYNNELKHPLIVNQGSSIGVIVEDAFSACAIARMGVGGIALLGTSMFDSYFVTLSETFDKLIVALDKDASAKALKMQKDLSQYLPTKLALLDTDLKYKSEAVLADWLQRTI